MNNKSGQKACKWIASLAIIALCVFSYVPHSYGQAQELPYLDFITPPISPIIPTVGGPCGTSASRWACYYTDSAVSGLTTAALRITPAPGQAPLVLDIVFNVGGVICGQTGVTVAPPDTAVLLCEYEEGPIIGERRRNVWLLNDPTGLITLNANNSITYEIVESPSASFAAQTASSRPNRELEFACLIEPGEGEISEENRNVSGAKSKQDGYVRSQCRAFDMNNPDALTADSGGDAVFIDVKPWSCPNRVNVNPAAKAKGRARSVLRVAILGEEDFDVTQIDLDSLRLEGVPPLSLRPSINDVGTPRTDEVPADVSDCNAPGPDGYDDLIVKFSRREIIAALGSVSNREEVRLTLTGFLNNGAAIAGQDVVVIVGQQN